MCGAEGHARQRDEPWVEDSTCPHALLVLVVVLALAISSCAMCAVSKARGGQPSVRRTYGVSSVGWLAINQLPACRSAHVPVCAMWHKRVHAQARALACHTSTGRGMCACKYTQHCSLSP